MRAVPAATVPRGEIFRSQLRRFACRSHRNQASRHAEDTCRFRPLSSRAVRAAWLPVHQPVDFGDRGEIAMRLGGHRRGGNWRSAEQPRRAQAAELEAPRRSGLARRALRPPIGAFVQSAQALVLLFFAGKEFGDALQPLDGFGLERILEKNLHLHDQIFERLLRASFLGDGARGGCLPRSLRPQSRPCEWKRLLPWPRGKAHSGGRPGRLFLPACAIRSWLR